MTKAMKDEYILRLWPLPAGESATDFNLALRDGVVARYPSRRAALRAVREGLVPGVYYQDESRLELARQTVAPGRWAESRLAYGQELIDLAYRDAEPTAEEMLLLALVLAVASVAVVMLVAIMASGYTHARLGACLVATGGSVVLAGVYRHRREV